MSSTESRLRERLSQVEEENRLLRRSLSESSDPFCRLNLTQQMRALMLILMRREVASHEDCHAAMEADRRSLDGRCQYHHSTVIKSMRGRLAPFGIVIKSDYGRGYALSPQSKARVREICEGRSDT